MQPAVVFQSGQTDPLLVFVVLVVLAVAGGLAFAYRLIFFRSIDPKRKTDPGESKTNCRDCGARIPATADSCHYCGTSVRACS